ncbi:hypothetical protein GN074_08685, partial [Helicobacter pylori]|nr:hypothetical protein [Helicobacter pylori]
KYWSEVLGEVSIEQYRVGESQVPDEFRKKVVRSVSAEEKTTALINIDELQRMELGELIAVVRGFPPIRLRSYPIERPESEGNPIAWVHRAMLAWRNAHLREGIGERWIREARRFLEGAAEEPAPEGGPPAAGGGGVPPEDSPPLGVPASAGPEGDRPPGASRERRVLQALGLGHLEPPPSARHEVEHWLVEEGHIGEGALYAELSRASGCPLWPGLDGLLLERQPEQAEILERLRLLSVRKEGQAYYVTWRAFVEDEIAAAGLERRPVALT